MSYNGWPNYQTWAVYTWLGNDEDTYWTVTSQAEQESSVYDLEQWLRGYVRDTVIGDLGASLAADLVNAALGDVDWRHLASSYWDEAERDSEPLELIPATDEDGNIAPQLLEILRGSLER